MVSVTKSADNKTTAVRTAEANPLLGALGDRVRARRERHGITRKALAGAAGVSERHLANLEYGEGNVSLLVLDQVAAALQCPLAELTGDFTTRSPEWLLLRNLLANRDEATLRRVRVAATELLGADRTQSKPTQRIALIGLRGAGKSTLGEMLAAGLGCAFVELSREIEKLAACGIGEIPALYGMAAYRRYERRALEDVIAKHNSAVIATPGGLVSEPETFDLLLSNCSTIWLQAKPEDHMKRVVEQGDFRPMRGNREAMQDLKRILEARRAYYARAQYRLNTSAEDLDKTRARLFDLADEIIGAASPEQHSAQTQLEEMLS